MDEALTWINFIARGIEFLGVLVMVCGLVYSLVVFCMPSMRKAGDSYVSLRQNMGKSILLGLEILIAADIITTIITEPDLNSVTILGIIVFIRIILSFSLQVEIEGRFPWQQKNNN